MDNALGSFPSLPDGLDRWALFLNIGDGLPAAVPQTGGAAGEPLPLDLLHRLRVGLDGALALVSGRDLATMDDTIGSRFDAIGAHGREWRLADRIWRIAEGGDDSGAWLDGDLPGLAIPGLVVERKAGRIILHFPGNGLPAADIHALASALRGRLPDDYRLFAGHSTIELVPERADKGSAIALFMEQPPYAGRVPIFIGEDATDESGFAMVNRLRGMSVCLGARIASAAEFRLSSASALHAWLAALVQRTTPADTAAGA